MLEGHAQASVTGTERKKSGVSSCTPVFWSGQLGEGVQHTGAAPGEDEKFGFPCITHGSFLQA